MNGVKDEVAELLDNLSHRGLSMSVPSVPEHLAVVKLK